jgi:hypothetical protein
VAETGRGYGPRIGPARPCGGVDDKAASKEATEAHRQFHGVFLRTLAWMHTLTKLNEPVDFQAVVVASRALFEIAVDTVLMLRDPKANPAEKMIAWEDSAKLKSATRAVEFFARAGHAVSEPCVPMQDYVKKHAARIERLRATYWPGKNGKGRHPDRWTGRHLGEDAAAADALLPSGDFTEFYATVYPARCWNTHGSGLAGVRHLDSAEFPGVSALAFGDCATFALLVAEEGLRAMALWSEVVEREFKDHDERSTMTKYVTAFGRRG